MVYDLHMRLETLSKALTFYDMGDIFKILTSNTVALLESKLDVYFNTQTAMNSAHDLLATNPTNTTFKTSLMEAVVEHEVALLELEAVSLEPTDLLTNYKGIGEDEVCMLNQYYSTYGSDYLVDNLAWSNNNVLNTCKEPLKNNILEGVVEVDVLE